MRRRITLYIGGVRADLADDGLVLLNYAVTDLTNPAVVRNAWTQTVDLPRSAGNERIFGHAGRLDRLAGDGGTGPDFNAARKTPFSIYTETGEILFSGYCKLESVDADAYHVSLYGGLGELMYNLSYDSAGNKRTLASLDYGTDLDFTIDKTAVADAWARLAGDTTKPAKWDIINFAPCYNGIPSDFQADKAVAVPTDVGLPSEQTDDDGNTYDAANTGGYALVNLSKAWDEWACKDLRSYLQRPVLSMRAFLDAVADPANNGGWSVDISDLASVPYADTWLTRPLLPSLGTYRQTPVGATATVNPLGWTAVNPFGQFLVTDAPPGSEMNVRMDFEFWFRVTSASADTLQGYKRVERVGSTPAGYHQLVLFCQAVAYDANNSKVSASEVQPFYYSASVISPEALAAACGYTPDSLNETFASPDRDHGYAKQSAGEYKRQRDLSLTVSGTDIARVDIDIRPYFAFISDEGGVVTSLAGAYLWDTAGDDYHADYASVPTGTGTATGMSADTLRSGALVTKEMLLSTGGTPADYLLAFCKAFGLYILASRASRSVRILTRNTFYGTGVTTTLDGRVDIRTINVQPLAFDAKWYELKHPSVGGQFEKEYLETEGVQYGIQRVDTGYDFDADTKDLLSGSVLKSAAAVTDRGAYWRYIDRPEISGTKTTGKFWGPNGLQSHANMTYTQYPVTYTQTYTVSGIYAPSSGYNYLTYVFLDSGGNLITGQTGPMVQGPTTLYGLVIDDIPATAAYVAVNTHKNGVLSFREWPASVPAVMLEPGVTYTLRDTGGKDLDTDVYFPLNDFTETFYNPAFHGYDIYSRAEFRDAENKALDGSDVLLFHNFEVNYPYFTLTDDLPVMDTVAGGPCWLLMDNPGGVDIPNFTRYSHLGQDPLDILDFGFPREVDIPGVNYGRGTSVYETAWQQYIRDRLSVHGKVMRCKVLLDGLQVGPDLFRRFWWYGGSIWVLSSVKNYSLTTFDPAECEFIQVRDTSAYSGGQSY